MADDFNAPALEWITTFLADSDEDRINSVAHLLEADERAQGCVSGHHSLLQDEAAFQRHRADTYLGDYNFLDYQFKAQSRRLAQLKAEGAPHV